MKKLAKIKDLNWQHALILLVSIFVFCISHGSARLKSVTFDEVALVPYGLALKGRHYETYSGVTPLQSMIASFHLDKKKHSPVFEDDFSPPHTWGYALAFQEKNIWQYHELIAEGRLPSMFAFIILILIACVFAEKLYGRNASLVTLFLVAFSPNIIAHARLAGSDIFLALAAVLTLYALDLFFDKANKQRSLLLGLCIGVSCLFKYTAGLFFLVLPLSIWIICRKEKTSAKQYIVPVIFSCIVAVTTINAGYGFKYNFPKLGDMPFNSELGKKAQTNLPEWLPIPLPEPYVQQLDNQLYDETYIKYLLGEFRENAFLEYYIVAFLVKTPLATLLIWILAFALFPKIKSREIPILLTVVIFTTFLSWIGHKNIGIRYLLLIYPLMAIFSARLFHLSQNTRNNLKKHAGKTISAVASTSTLIITLNIWPHYLSYFNWPSGGPRSGHKYLLDSNLDWGQDLKLLGTYMRRNSIDKISLAYGGRVQPRVYRIHYDHVQKDPKMNKTRYAAISANLLWGRMYYTNAVEHFSKNRQYYAKYRNLEPIKVIGNTIYVYDLENM